MTTTGPEVFDRTIRTTNPCLEEIMAELGPDREPAWHAPRAVLPALRDRLPLGEAARPGAEAAWPPHEGLAPPPGGTRSSRGVRPNSCR